MNKPLDISILQALRPSQARAKLCLAPAKVFYDSTAHLSDAMRVMSDTDCAALTKAMEEVAKAAEAMQRARDALAALTNKWGTSALGLDEAEQATREVVAEIQSAVRMHYAEIYIP